MIKRFSVNPWLPAMLAMAGAALLGAPTAARATLMLESMQIANGSTQVAADTLFMDNNPGAAGVTAEGVGETRPEPAGGDTIGLDTAPGVGALTIGDGVTPVQVGAFAVLGSAHTSNSPGDPTTGGLLISHSISVVNNTAAAATQQVVVGDTGYKFPAPGLMTTTNIASGTITNGTIVIKTWDDPSNRQFGGGVDHPGGAAILLSSLTFTNQSYAVVVPFTANVAYDPAVGYSKTIEFDVTLSPGGTLVNRSDSIQNQAAVPEIDPGSAASALACLGSGVLMLAGRRRKRTRA